MVSCMNCFKILTIMNATSNKKETNRVTTEFKCTCGAKMRVIQYVYEMPKK